MTGHSESAAKSGGTRGGGCKQIAFNRKAYYDYEVEEKIECGIVLLGTEIKSVKDGKISFPDAWAEITGGEVWLNSFKIAEYPFSSIYNHDPDRRKKLLLHKKEIKRLTRRVEEKGYTLVPLSFYLKGGRVKVELGVCRGKKQYDKRAGIRERDLNREMAREIRGVIRH
jgi:SsrA-binding protein